MLNKAVQLHRYVLKHSLKGTSAKLQSRIQEALGPKHQRSVVAHWVRWHCKDEAKQDAFQYLTELVDDYDQKIASAARKEAEATRHRRQKIHAHRRGGTGGWGGARFADVKMARQAKKLSAILTRTQRTLRDSRASGKAIEIGRKKGQECLTVALGAAAAVKGPGVTETLPNRARVASKRVLRRTRRPSPGSN